MTTETDAQDRTAEKELKLLAVLVAVAKRDPAELGERYIALLRINAILRQRCAAVERAAVRVVWAVSATLLANVGLLIWALWLS